MLFHCPSHAEGIWLKTRHRYSFLKQLLSFFSTFRIGGYSVTFTISGLALGRNYAVYLVQNVFVCFGFSKSQTHNRNKRNHFLTDNEKKLFGNRTFCFSMNDSIF